MITIHPQSRLLAAAVLVLLAAAAWLLATDTAQAAVLAEGFSWSVRP